MKEEDHDEAHEIIDWNDGHSPGSIDVGKTALMNDPPQTVCNALVVLVDLDKKKFTEKMSIEVLNRLDQDQKDSLLNRVATYMERDKEETLNPAIKLLVNAGANPDIQVYGESASDIFKKYDKKHGTNKSNDLHKDEFSGSSTLLPHTSSISRQSSSSRSI